MPAPWLLVHTASLLIFGSQSTAPKKMKFANEVTVTYLSGSGDANSQQWSFDNGVVIEYDVTTIQADHVDIDGANQVGRAHGHVHLYDPVARVDAENLEWRWGINQKIGHADNAFIQIGSSRLKARTVDISPAKWVLHDVEGTTSRAHPAWYEVHTKTLTIIPGKQGTLQKPSLYILGSKIATFPDRTFNLDQRSEGLTIPGFNYNHQNGLGVSWGGGFLLDHATDIAFSAGVFPDSRPGYGASITRSLLDDSKPITLITPPSDFGERFAFGYMDDIAVASPEGEDRNLRSPQKSISVDSIWNQVLTDRGTAAPFSKAIEGVYELGGSADGFGYITQARLQTIREYGDSFQERAVLVGDLGLPVIRLTPNLRTVARIDSDVFLGDQQYAWFRGFAGVAYMPITQLRLSAGGYYSGDAGNPQYLIDPLYSKAGYVIRGDVNLGPTKFSYLQKYDGLLGWFDREYMVAQVVGCFEPFIMYRKNPSDYQLGLRLRLDDLTDLMTKRNFARPPAPVSHVISPAADGNP